MVVDPVAIISEEAITRLTQEMVRIPSQYMDGKLAEHREIAQYLAGVMQTIGLDVDRVEAVEDYPVVVGATPGGDDGPVYGVICHYSTVGTGSRDDWERDPFGGELVEGCIHGRGSADQKGGIAAVIEAARCIMESGLERKGQLRLLMVPGEGCTELALEPIVANPTMVEKVRCDTYIDADSGSDSIVRVYGGWIWIELTTEGKGGHAGALTSDGTVPINPVDKMVDVLSYLKSTPWMKAERHPLFGPEANGRHSPDPIMDIDVFQAGSKVNIIPFHATAQIDIRLLPSQHIPQVLEELEAALDYLRSQDPDLTVSYRIIGRSKNEREVPADHPVITAIKDACREFGLPKPPVTGGNSGGRAALAKLGAVLSFGAGGGSNIHAPNEYAPVELLVTGAKLHARIYNVLLS